MYCHNCGKKIKENDNYCNKCGKKIEKKTNTNSKNNTNLSLIIGIISIIGSFIFGIFILPLAIFGIIISIKNNKKEELILNVIASLLSIIIFTLIFFILFKSFNFLKDNYKDTFKDIPNYHDKNYHDNKYNNEEEPDIDITGNWFLYQNNIIDQTTNYKFNSNKTFSYTRDNETHTGTYNIKSNNTYPNYIPNNYKYYELTLHTISITKNDGSITTNNMEDYSYKIYLNNDILEVQDLKTNTYFSLKKDVSVIY